ncbi:diaminobutyrate acetyltransferase [Gordonia sp. (in: high G+C Gram-positive bacteria)]|uniref:diaminobutyrate acetyltransferase n=1 Tax=Gordonia sp. (in: high G+C Gram-positive bacteria) TaxID=84139 RepID=UPI003C77ED9D
MKPIDFPQEDFSKTAVAFRRPQASDGQRIWEIARDSRVLDVNSPYSYILWSQEFSETSIVAEVDGVPIGFVTGYRRPADPASLMVWQVAVDDAHRGKQIAKRMLCELFHRGTQAGVTAINTTISPDNEASQRLFAGVARALGLNFSHQPFFAAELFPNVSDDGLRESASHQPEDLYLLTPAD